VDGNFIGVVAQREEQAVKARLAAIAAASWREEAIATDEAGLYEYFESRATRDIVLLDRSDLAVQKSGTREIEAVYKKPYLAHAAIGPSCAVARITGNGDIEVWSHTQGVYPLRDELALVLGVAPQSVRVHHAEGAGCFGHNGADDVALDAILLSRAAGGVPVKVQWMRDDEFAWEPSGSAMLMKLRGALDAAGNVTDWQYGVWGNGYRHRPGSGKPGTWESSLSASWLLAKPVPKAPQYDQAMVGDKGGGGGLAMNAVSLYDFANQHSESHLVAERPIRVSSLRSLGGYGNIFAVESFMDELAIAAGADPVAFRLRYLTDPRARAVVELAAQKSGWQPGDSDGVTGRGVAFAQVSNQYSYVAVVAEITIDPDLRVKRVVAAVDVGQALNPDGVINQIEGGIVQAVSWTLKEQVRFGERGVTSLDWEHYPILTFPEVPLVEVHLIDRPHEVPVGAGESVMGQTAAAIANALHHIAGVRIRELPITREKIAAA
jgi:CO/xanthine dehydrogenase Mo-binding subunit